MGIWSRCLQFHREWVTKSRLAQHWNPYAASPYPRWPVREFYELNHATRKDGFVNSDSYAVLSGAAYARSRLGGFVLPSETTEWRDEAMSLPEKTLWVRKPTSESCGRGIIVGNFRFVNKAINSPNGLEAGVIQRYVHKPLLLGGLKFDLRFYAVLVQEVFEEIPRLCLFRDGLARFATIKYYKHDDKAAVGEQKGYVNQDAHITNYSLHSDSGGFVEAPGHTGKGGLDSKGEVRSHKWSAAEALSFITTTSTENRNLWNAVGEAVRVAVSDAFTSWAAVAELSSTVPPQRGRCFEMFGVDILLDTEHRPHVLELQRRPSLDGSSALDLRVKSQLLDALEELLQKPGGQACAKMQWWQQLRLESIRLRNARTSRMDADQLAAWHAVEAVIAHDIRSTEAAFTRGEDDFRHCSYN